MFYIYINIDGEKDEFDKEFYSADSALEMVYDEIGMIDDIELDEGSADFGIYEQEVIIYNIKGIDDRAYEIGTELWVPVKIVYKSEIYDWDYEVLSECQDAYKTLLVYSDELDREDYQVGDFGYLKIKIKEYFFDYPGELLVEDKRFKMIWKFDCLVNNGKVI